MASRNPALAEKAAREIDIQLLSLEDSAQRAGLLLEKAVLYGACSRFDDARKQIDLAVKENSTDPDFRLSVDFIRASLYDQEGFPDKSLTHLTELLSAHARKLALSEFRDLYEDIQQRRALDSACVGEYNEAIPLLRECLSFNLSAEIRVSILCNLGNCYSQLKDYEGATRFVSCGKRDWPHQGMGNAGSLSARDRLCSLRLFERIKTRVANLRRDGTQ
jgi:tetratricopeptide (TPR) repeat protein